MSGNVKSKRMYYGDNQYQFGDLRLPGGEGSYPTAIIIHGGFWRERVGLDIMDSIADNLSGRGIATWNIEYRRVGHEGGGWPGTLTDVARAADYLHTLAESNTLDLNRVVTMGHSAGGHLALSLAARHRLPETSILKVSEQPLPIKGAVSLAGVSDLALMQEVHHIQEVNRNISNNPVSDFMAGPPDEVPSHYAEASPLELLPIGVPQVLVHGPLDIHVPIGISYSYKKAADRAGDNVKMVEISSAEHFKLIDPQSGAWSIIAQETASLLKS
jgi:acetyl esterase/lipase